MILTITLTIIVTLLFLWIIASIFIVKRLTLRLFQFDAMYENIVEDILTYSEYLDGFITKSTFSNSPEIVALNKNVLVMKQRLDSYAESYKDISKRKRKVKAPKVERPVVVD